MWKGRVSHGTWGDTGPGREPGHRGPTAGTSGGLSPLTHGTVSSTRAPRRPEITECWYTGISRYPNPLPK